MKSLLRLIWSSQQEVDLIDHVPVKASGKGNHQEALKAAAQRHGKPFKCAADGLPRERMERESGGRMVAKPVSAAKVCQMTRRSA